MMTSGDLTMEEAKRMQTGRLSAIERLARDICWVEFTIRPKDTTRAGYWASLPQATRDRYIASAKWLVWINGRIPEAIARASA